MARDRDAAMAVTMAVAGAIGGFCGALVNVLIGFNQAAAADAPSSSGVAALVAGNTSTVARVLIAGYLGAGTVAILLAAVVLWRSPETSRWLPALLAVGLGVAALSPPEMVAVPLSVPFLIGSAILAMRIRDRAALDRI